MILYNLRTVLHMNKIQYPWLMNATKRNLHGNKKRKMYWCINFNSIEEKFSFENLKP